MRGLPWPASSKKRGPTAATSHLGRRTRIEGAMRVAGWILAVASTLLMAAPVWVWAQQGEGGWQLALVAVVLIAGGMLAHTLVALGICLAAAWIERRFATALIAAHVIAIACG